MKSTIPDKAKIDLHIHPYFENYPFSDLLSLAEKKEINVMGLIQYNDDIFPALHRATRTLPKEMYEVRADNGTCIKICNKKTRTSTYLLKTIEMMTGDSKGKENFHVLAIGDIHGLQLRKEGPFPQTEKCIESIIKNDGVAIIDHPYVNPQFIGKSINMDKEIELEAICKEFRENLSLEWNGQCIPLIRFVTVALSSLKGSNPTNYDANRNAEILAEKLKDYKTKLIADSDIHARSRYFLDGMGKGHIEIFKEFMDYSNGKTIVKSIKNAIKIGDGKGYGYKNIKEYVSIPKFIAALGVPYLLRFDRNRG